MHFMSPALSLRPFFITVTVIMAVSEVSLKDLIIRVKAGFPDVPGLAACAKDVLLLIQYYHHVLYNTTYTVEPL